jgi:hypothetical protein
MSMSLLVSVIVIACTDSARINLHKTASAGISKEPSTDAEDLVDITSYMDHDLFTELGYNCCCDRDKKGLTGFKDTIRHLTGGERANYCTVLETDKCGGVKVAETTVKAHNYASTVEGKCEIQRSKLFAFSMLVRDNTLVDITQNMEKNAGLLNEKGYKCCCDREKEGTGAAAKDAIRGIVLGGERSNFCSVVKTEKCGDVKVSDEATLGAHDHVSTAGGKCEILRMDLSSFSKLIGEFVHYNE